MALFDNIKWVGQNQTDSGPAYNHSLIKRFSHH
jgi:hypothetical protein